jgi:hypothetical protein
MSFVPFEKGVRSALCSRVGEMRSSLWSEPFSLVPRQSGNVSGFR